MWLLAATSRLALCAAFSLRSLRSANQLQGRMVETLFIVGDFIVTVGQALIALATLAFILLVVVAVKLGRAARERRSEAAAEAVRSEQMTSLREVLANKQARGAFGQARMEAIVRDGLPKGAYEFQFTLSNRTRPDCVVFLPVDQRPLVIDAKFPLEAATAFREGKTDEAKKQAAQRLRQDVLKHITDIAERYLIPGETQELALMFVPSESVYAELYDGFDDLIQKAYRAQVVLVSPSLLMLAIQVMQQIQKDARMREAAHEIRTEVGYLMDDLGRLHERVLNLQKHFGQANNDVAQILISADKVAKRGGRIETLEFDAEETPREARLVMPTPIGPKIDAAE